jgi:hypothetical protein
VATQTAGGSRGWRDLLTLGFGSWVTALGLAVGVFFWSMVTHKLITTSVYQLRALGYSSTSGAITAADIRPATRSRIDFSYEYEVEAVRFTGGRYRKFYDQSPDPPFHPYVGAPYAEALRRDYPVGRQIPVYYDSDDPADSLLRPGLEAIDLRDLLMLGSPVLLVLAFLLGAGGWVYRRWRFAVTGGHPVRTVGGQTWLHRMSGAAVLAILGAGLAGSVIAILLTVILAYWELPLWGAVLALVAVVALAGLTYFNGRSDENYLVIDRDEGVLKLPPGESRPALLAVPFGALRAVLLRTVMQPGGGAAFYPTLVRAAEHDRPVEEPVLGCQSRKEAEALTAWLYDILSAESPITRGEDRQEQEAAAPTPAPGAARPLPQ